MNRKERILDSCNSIPLRNLINYIRKGEVSLSELIAAGLLKEKENEIRTEMADEDNASWAVAQRNNTVSAYSEYLEKFPEGLHANEARQAVDALDDDVWFDIQSNLNEEQLNKYKALFPAGKHIAECNELLVDLPWLETKRRNTIFDYNEYQLKYPGQHEAEIKTAINALSDDKDWDNACIVGDSQAYRRYLEQHPYGNHAQEASNRIQANASRDKFLKELRDDRNAYSPCTINDKNDDNKIGIQEKVNNGVATWADIADIFGYDEAEAIKNYVAPSDLPNGIPPAKLKDDSTEVYFWGTPSSGKTCALGAILSNAAKSGILEKLPCQGYDYMTLLSNIFGKNGFCTLPYGSSMENIQEMMVNLRDGKNRPHKMTLIDLAGELFRMVYFKQNNLFIDDVAAETLTTTMNYLRDTRNNKIHFFVVEYNAHDKKWEGRNMVDYLDCMSAYLKSEGIFTKKTVGVYVLVTKCDMIDCAPEDRPRFAAQYVEEELPSFWKNLRATCKDSGVGDLKILSFSIGEVFAKGLCKFDSQDTDKVIDKLLTKTPAKKGRWSEFWKG